MIHEDYHIQNCDQCKALVDKMVKCQFELESAFEDAQVTIIVRSKELDSKHLMVTSDLAYPALDILERMFVASGRDNRKR